MPGSPSVQPAATKTDLSQLLAPARRAFVVGVAALAAISGTGCDDSASTPAPLPLPTLTGNHVYRFDGKRFPEQLVAFQIAHPELEVSSITMSDKSRSRVWEYMVLTTPATFATNYSEWAKPTMPEKWEYFGAGVAVLDERDHLAVGARLDQFKLMNPNWSVRDISVADISDSRVWKYVVTVRPDR